MTQLIEIRLDYETYGEIDLTVVGAHNYAEHESTDVLVARFRFRALGAKEWTRGEWRAGQPYPFIGCEIRRVYAWNSSFERLMWNGPLVRKHGWPELPLETFVCTSAQARQYASAPAKLEKAAQFFGLKVRKDMQGHRHMLYMCRPAPEKEQLAFLLNNPGSSAETCKRCHHTKENLDVLSAYCETDVDVESAIADILPPWSDRDLRYFHESEYINDYGVNADVLFAQSATAFSDAEKEMFNVRLAELTNNVVTTPRQFARIKDWALPRMSDEAIEVLKYYDKGICKYSLDDGARKNLLASAAEDSDFLTPEVKELVEILDMAGKSTISKYTAIVNTASSKGILRGMYMFAGAAQSGRYSSKGVQIHNLKRSVPKNAVEHIDAFIDGKPLESDKHPLHTLAELVRPTLHGGDNYLAWCDWSAIEACVLPWLTLDPRAEDRLDVFRSGGDIYLATASNITGRTITAEDKDERQLYGKIPELALGYCGGDGALASMASNFGIFIPKEQRARIVSDWREANPWALDFGTGLERAAIDAIYHPGIEYSHGRLAYVFDECALGGIGSLYCILPSGRKLCYPGARLDVTRTPWGDKKLSVTALRGAWNPKKGEDDWPRKTLWPGLFAENPTQAVATGDLLNEALVRANAVYDLNVCLHTHDEICIETAFPEADSARLKECMLTRPKWPGAGDLPLNAVVEWGKRYKVVEHV